MTGTVETYVREPGTMYDDLLKGYRTAFYFDWYGRVCRYCCCSFVRMPNVHKSSRVHQGFLSS